MGDLVACCSNHCRCEQPIYFVFLLIYFVQNSYFHRIRTVCSFFIWYNSFYGNCTVEVVLTKLLFPGKLHCVLFTWNSIFFFIGTVTFTVLLIDVVLFMWRLLCTVLLINIVLYIWTVVCTVPLNIFFYMKCTVHRSTDQ